MIEYAKIILPEVSFNKELFQKELKKCMNWIEPKDVQQFRDWCYVNFKNLYPDILEEELVNSAV